MFWRPAAFWAESLAVDDARLLAHSTEASASLRRLEQRLDGWPAPWGRRALTIWRAKRSPALPRAPAHFARLAMGGHGGSAELVSALAFALGAGACESSSTLGERVLRALPTMPATIRAQAVVLLVDALLMRGDRARAVELALTHEAALSRSAAGVSLLELLDVGEPRLWLPDGRVNLLGCSRRGHWPLEQLASELLSKPWAWSRQPELSLLFFSSLQATDAPRALAFLNRFLASHGVPRCFVNSELEAGRNSLAGLRFGSTAAVRVGPLVSVLVAARNAAETIAYALDSLLAQSYQSLEILVGDDASDDQTRKVLRDRYGREARVRLFGSVTRQGAYNVRNALAAHARGSLLTCHDADDFALPTRIATQVAKLQRAGTVGCVTSWLRLTEDGRFVFFKNQKATRLAQVSLMLTREAFDVAGPFRAVRVGADQELFARLRARYGEGAVVRVRAPMILGLWGRGSETRGVGIESLEDGYRSPQRRLYSQLVFAQHEAGFPRLSSEEIDELLRASGNHVSPSGLIEIT